METKKRGKLVLGIWLASMSILLGSQWTEVSAQKAFPLRSIELIVPWGGGGTTYMGAKVVADALSTELAKPVVTIEKVGAGGTIAASSLARSKADGYTLGIVAGANTSIATSIRKVPYKIEDFEFIGQYGQQILGLEVKADAPWKTLGDFIEYARKNPSTIKYATSGVGTSGEFGMELLKIDAGGLKMDPLRFTSGPEMTAALLGGHAHAIFDYEGVFKPLVKSGKTRLLAIAKDKRHEEYPEVPTFSELGYPSVKVTAWYGIAAPKGLPKEVSDRLKEAFGKATQNANVKSTLTKLGYIPAYRSGVDLAQWVKEESKMYQMVAEKVGIKLE